MSILYAYYGDDFTGSTDVLERLASKGVPAVLFLGLPTAAQVAAFPGVQAIGIAGDSRSRSPEWMASNLPPIFANMQLYGAPVTQYKVCSTFDSGPQCGSVGRAMELGLETFNPRFVPIVVGAPHLHRYVAFGNLFASAPDGVVYRIDRHPMSRHPVTPMHEADIGLHLDSQTTLPIGRVDLQHFESQDTREALERELAAGYRTILFDTTDQQMLAEIGEILWEEALLRPLFSVGSSGLTAALLAAWSKRKLVCETPAALAVKDAGPLLVVSGSCSAATEKQLRWAFAHGYRGINVDPAMLLHPTTAEASQSAAIKQAAESLATGTSTILYTALGLPSTSVQGEKLGTALGALLREILQHTNARRVLLCGGDTASHAVQQLGIYALTWLADLQLGAPLCRAHAEATCQRQDLEFVLKGGQIGTEDFFEMARCGGEKL